MTALFRLRFVFGMGSLLCALAAVWPAAARAATRAGDAVVVDDAAGAPLTHGAKATLFTLKLPAGASCQGDSATGGYHVQSYMVPASVDPATLTYGSEGPLPTATGLGFRQPLFASSSNPYAANTANATNHGGVGPIVNIPAMNFAVYRPGQVPAGTYNVGIACTRGQASPTQLQTFWNTQMTVAADLSWTATAPSAAAPAPAAPAPAAAVIARAAATSTATPATSPAAAETASPAAAAATATRDSAPAAGAPSWNFPVADLLAQAPLHDPSRPSLALLAAVLFVAMRICYLLPRSTRLVPAVAA